MKHRGMWAWVAMLVLSCFPIAASAQQQDTDQLTLGTSNSEFTLHGNGTGTDQLALSINSQGAVTFTNGLGTITTCADPNNPFVFACGSASGSGALNAFTDTTTAAFFSITSPMQSPLTLVSTGDGGFFVNQSAPLVFSFSSAQGTLTGTISLEAISMDGGMSSTTATGCGTLTVTGGSFASVFTTGMGNVVFSFALGGNLDTLVGTSASMTGQVEFPSTITPQQPGTNGCGDFLTGGGWISNSAASGPGSSPGGGNGKATFAIRGGCKHCKGWGDVNYIDHATGMHVHGTADDKCAIAYSVVSNGAPNANGQPTGCRRMRGAAEVNNQAGFTYDVIACDNGEPGTSDTFTISVSNGYTNSGTLGGGNIQLHKGNKSFCCSAPQ